jgi:hypothetical protein
VIKGLNMKVVLCIIYIILSTAVFAGENLTEYKINFESKRKQFQKSINSGEMQKNADEWNKFVETELSKFLQENEKNITIKELHKKWLNLKIDYWTALDKKYKNAIGSISSIDHVRSQLDFTSNHLQSLLILVD